MVENESNRNPQPITGSLKARGIDKAAARYGWTEYNMSYWRYPIKDPLTGVWAWRFKAMPGTTGPKYFWQNPNATGDNSKKKPDGLHYYAPQGGMEVKAAVAAAGGVLHIANGEPAVLVMVSAGYNNVLSWTGETSIPTSLPSDLHSLGVTHVIYWPDNDPTGKSAAVKVKQACVNASIHFEARDHGVKVEKADLNDLWIAVGFDHHEFRRRLDAAPLVPLPEVYAKSAFQRVYDDAANEDNKQRLIGDIEAHIHRYAQGVKQSRDWLNHRSLIRDGDDRPSAGFNLRTGVYNDFTGKTMSVWQFAEALGLRLEDYRAPREPRKVGRPPKKAAAPAPAPTQDGAPITPADEPAPYKPPIDIPLSPVDARTHDAFWWGKNWRKEHRLLIIAGPINLAQAVARFREALYHGLIGQSFNASEFADAIEMARSKVGPLLATLTDILWTVDRGIYTVMPKPDMDRLMAERVIPALHQRYFKKHVVKLTDILSEVMELDDEAIDFHTTQAEIMKFVKYAENDEMKSFIHAVQILSVEPLRYELPDPYLSLTLYRRACVRNFVGAYEVANEGRIQDSIAARADDYKARVSGATNSAIAEAIGLNVDTVRGITKQMRKAGVLYGYPNEAFVEFDRTSPLLNCKSAEMRTRIQWLPKEHFGRLISVKVERGGITEYHNLTHGVNDYALAAIAAADKVYFRLQQATAYVLGHEDVEALFGTPPKEVADDKAANMGDDEPAAPASESSALDEQPAPAPAKGKERPWAKDAEKRLAKRLKENPAASAYSARWILNQAWLGYQSNPPENIKAQYARLLGLPLHLPTVQANFEDIPF